MNWKRGEALKHQSRYLAKLSTFPSDNHRTNYSTERSLIFTEFFQAFFINKSSSSVSLRFFIMMFVINNEKINFWNATTLLPSSFFFLYSWLILAHLLLLGYEIVGKYAKFVVKIFYWKSNFSWQRCSVTSKSLIWSLWYRCLKLINFIWSYFNSVDSHRCRNSIYYVTLKTKKIV